MQCISRNEQQRIIMQLQEDFDHLVRKSNQQAIISYCALTQADALLKEIKDINKNRFFEEDLQKSLENCAARIMRYIQESYPQPLRSSAALPKHRVHVIALIDLEKKLHPLLRLSSPYLAQGGM